MATSERSEDQNKDIPDYEYIDVNSKSFLISSFRDQWLSRLRPKDYSYHEENKETFDANFAAEFGLDVESMNKLKSVCSPDSLCCHDEDEEPDKEAVPQNSTLKTLIKRKKREESKSALTIPANRHDVYANELERLTVGRKPDTEADMIPEGEIILSINVYFSGLSDKFNYVRPHMTLVMTGSQSLAEFKDAICCTSDLQVCGEFSQTPDVAPDFTNKDQFRSSFFFFEGVFYNDMRYPECKEISITTIEWAKSHNFPPYRRAKMEDTLFKDLEIKVGFPYLYCHQGDCEHLVIITDVRLSHRMDCLDRKLYPVLTHKHRVSTQKCSVCHIFIARWYTTNDPFAPSDPCLFCDKCFRMLHYDTNNKKIGAFLAFPYVDRGAFN